MPAMKFVVTILLLFSTALAAASRAPRNNETHREAYKHYVRGQKLLASERFDGAAEEFQAATKLEDVFTDAYLGLGHAYMGLRRYDNAVHAYQQCLDAARTIFDMRRQNRDTTDRLIDDQLRALREALAQTTLASRQRNGDLAIERRIRELEHSRSLPDGPFEAPAEVLLALGSAHYRGGDWITARGRWEEAVKVNPNLGEAWNNLAVVYMQSGRRGDAELAIRNAEKHGVRVNPKLKEELRTSAFPTIRP
jgi:tetratricopeptide (TPR) repeat protein